MWPPSICLQSSSSVLHSVCVLRGSSMVCWLSCFILTYGIDHVLLSSEYYYSNSVSQSISKFYFKWKKLFLLYSYFDGYDCRLDMSARLPRSQTWTFLGSWRLCTISWMVSIAVPHQTSISIQISDILLPGIYACFGFWQIGSL